MASTVQTAPDHAQWLFGSNVVGFDLSEMSGASEADGGLGDCGPLENRRRKKRGEKPPSRSGVDSTLTSVQDRPLNQHQRFSDDNSAMIPVSDLISRDNKRRSKKKQQFTFDESGGEDAVMVNGHHIKETSLEFMNDNTHDHEGFRDIHNTSSNTSKGVQQWTSLEMNTGGGNGDSESPAEEMEGTLGRKPQSRQHRHHSNSSKHAKNIAAGGVEKKRHGGGSTSGRRDSNSAVTTADEGEDNNLNFGSRKGTTGKSQRGRLSEGESSLVDKKVSGASSSAFLSDDGGSHQQQGRGKPPMHWQTSSTQEFDDGAFDTVSISSKSTRGPRRGQSTDDVTSSSAVQHKKKRSNSKDLGFNTSFNTSSKKRGESPAPHGGDVNTDDVSCSTSLMGTLKSKQFPRLGAGAGGGNSPGAQSLEFDAHLDSKSANGGWTLASLGTLPPIQLSNHGNLQQPPQSKHGRTPSGSSTLPFD
ncbi:Hypothetical protein, putative [Bodo saltans]|uniref:Uncharacterized protein n=1 Tax=Bodo saltans TaxID=75058 RepID=A0A0S4JBD9_BODSA|nr:Hypothetical protein, putative [Bodo saltans]|eukprot:CUG86472.1 Hypothetical protein, putative [Bodo saltans]